MASSWRRTLGNARSFVSNSMGGLRGGSNLASWVVAGTLAYFLWIKPSQDLKREQQERAALTSSDPYRYVETRKPIPDPQVTGLIYGNKNKDKERFKMETINSEAYTVFGYRLVPVDIVQTTFANKPSTIEVILPDGERQEWTLIWNQKRPNQVQLGQGWYKFAKNFPLNLKIE